MFALRAVRPRLASPLAKLAPTLAVRGLRASAPAQSSVPTVTTSSGATIPVDKYFDDESLVAHQERVRHSDPANRTFNYTMIGAKQQRHGGARQRSRFNFKSLPLGVPRIFF